MSLDALARTLANECATREDFAALTPWLRPGHDIDTASDLAMAAFDGDLDAATALMRAVLDDRWRVQEIRSNWNTLWLCSLVLDDDEDLDEDALPKPMLTGFGACQLTRSRAVLLATVRALISTRDAGKT